ncbi:MAG: TonB-dependent receptor [Deltaproteobacteria bacterium]|nr:TonB-dependent receptor [Deltaproteobacteria bacterium]
MEHLRYQGLQWLAVVTTLWQLLAPAASGATELPGAATEVGGAAVPLPKPSPTVVEGDAELVVEGRRAGRVRAFDLDRSVHPLGQGQLRGTQPESTAAATAQLPGAFGQITNRGAGSPLLRGLIGPQNLIVIEGLRFNNATFRTGPNQYLATIDLSAVDRIELLLGPGGALYGSDAMGGVIGLYLPALPRFGSGGAPQGRAWMSFDSADGGKAIGASSAWGGDRVAFEVGGAFRDHEALRLGGGALARASDFRQYGWHARAAVRLDDAWSLQGTALGNVVLGAGRTDDLGRGIVRNYDNRDTFAWLELTRSVTEGVLRYFRLAAVAHAQVEVGSVARCTLQGGAVPSLDGCAADGIASARTPTVGLPATVTRHDEFTDDVRTFGAVAMTRLHLDDDRLKVTLGGEGWLDLVTSDARQRRNGTAGQAWKALERGNFSSGSTYSQVGAFVHADWRPVSGKVWSAGLNAGGRGGWVSAFAPAVPAVGDVNYALPVMAATGGAVLDLGGVAAVFANYSTGLRAPNLQETTVLGNTGDQFEVPNADLGAERIAAAEVGVRLDVGGTRALVSIFHNTVGGFIDRESVPSSAYGSYGVDASDLGCTTLGDTKCKPVARRVNGGEAQIVGAEVSVRGPSAWGFRPWATASWLQGETTVGTVTHPLRRAPPLNGLAGVRWQSADQDLYVEPWVRAAATQDQLNPGDTKDLRICENPEKPGTPYAGATCPGTAGWMTVNLRAGWRWRSSLSGIKAVRLDGDATNLLDARYRVHGSGIDGAGRGVRATASVEF